MSIVQRFLRVVPGRYSQMACSIETLLDLNTLSVEELIGHLHTAEERGRVAAPQNTGGHPASHGGGVGDAPQAT